MFSALVLQFARAVGYRGLINKGEFAVVIGSADFASDLIVKEFLRYFTLG
jgi:hypothetical protein